MENIYLTLVGTEYLAGPLVLLGCIPPANIDKEINIENVLLDYVLIEPYEIDRVNMNHLSRYIVYGLAIENKINRPTVVLCNPETKGSIYFNSTSKGNIIKKKYVNRLGIIVLHWWIDHYYDLISPKYKLRQNKGIKKYKQLEKVLEYGPDYRIHRSNIYEKIIKYWKKSLRSNNIVALTKNFLIDKDKENYKWYYNKCIKEIIDEKEEELIIDTYFSSSKKKKN